MKFKTKHSVYEKVKMSQYGSWDDDYKAYCVQISFDGLSLHPDEMSLNVVYTFREKLEEAGDVFSVTVREDGKGNIKT